MDDSYGAQVAGRAACPVISYGIDYPGDVRPVEVAITVNGISGTLATPKGEFFFASKLLGRFNLSNILAAVTAGIALDLPLEAIKSGIEGHTNIPGRLERVDNCFGVTCLVDYAHTGDALHNSKSASIATHFERWVSGLIAYRLMVMSPLRCIRTTPSSSGLGSLVFQSLAG